MAIAAGVAWRFWRSLPQRSPIWRTLGSPWTQRTTGEWGGGHARACTPRAASAALQAAPGPAQAAAHACGVSTEVARGGPSDTIRGHGACQSSPLLARRRLMRGVPPADTAWAGPIPRARGTVDA